MLWLLEKCIILRKQSLQDVDYYFALINVIAGFTGTVSSWPFKEKDDWQMVYNTHMYTLSMYNTVPLML